MPILGESWPPWRLVRTWNDWYDSPVLGGDLDVVDKAITTSAGSIRFEFTGQVNFNDVTGASELVLRVADTASTWKTNALYHYPFGTTADYLQSSWSAGNYNQTLAGAGNWAITGTGGTLSFNTWPTIALGTMTFDTNQTVGASQDTYGLEYVHSAGQIQLIDRGAEGWDDITADINASKVTGANQPSWTQFRDGIYAYEFSASSMNECWLVFHVKHDYEEGTNVYPHVHFSTTSTATTGVIRWGFEYTVAKGHDQVAFPATTTVYVEYTVSGSKQYQHIISEVADVDAFDAFEADTLILMRVFRDAGHANDTFTGTVHAFTADIHFQGNRTFTPNKSPPFI